MEYIIAVFRARTETINFANLLRSYGVNVMIITTPRQVNVSCGISVRFNKSALMKAKELLQRRRFDTFGGFYLIRNFGQRQTASPIV